MRASQVKRPVLKRMMSTRTTSLLFLRFFFFLPQLSICPVLSLDLNGVRSQESQTRITCKGQRGQKIAVTTIQRYD